MEELRPQIRQLILKLKTSEENQKKRRRELSNAYRNVQKDPISDASLKNCFALYTKRVLNEIKITDDLNKSFKEDLRTVLTKIRSVIPTIESKHLECKPIYKQKASAHDFVDSVNTSTTAASNETQIQTVSHKSISEFSNKKQTARMISESKIHPISSKCESNTKTRKIQAHDFDNNSTSNISTTLSCGILDLNDLARPTNQESAVIFQVFLTMSKEFTGRRIVIRVGVG